MLIDYHIHTAISRDAEGKLEDVIRMARFRGLEEVGVADHFHPGERARIACIVFTRFR